MERDRKVINDDRVKLEVLSSVEPPPMSYYGPDSFGFETIKKTVRQIWGSLDVIVSAGLHYMSFRRVCETDADCGDVHLCEPYLVTSSCVLCPKAGPVDDDAIWSGVQLFFSTPRS